MRSRTGTAVPTPEERLEKSTMSVRRGATHNNPAAFKRSSWAECSSVQLWSNRARTAFRKTGSNPVHGESGSNLILFSPCEPEPHLDPDVVRTRFSERGSGVVGV